MLFDGFTRVIRRDSHTIQNMLKGFPMSFSKHVGSWCTCFFLSLAGYAHAQIPTPSSVLGHTPGDDFYLANYEEAVKYFHVLAASSDRMKMFTVGKSSQGHDI